ncbi:unnamed protein product [Zymoseptoria tritici ST99CH_3D1]|uniref:Uncharacterized protein n=1 Tax=Zymoseptoria tritici (strain CBS 115943 / IPO323) TaxID=336722 RepID=F9XQ88_ZYMTI|nr:uncharacterized protein MYCGRDRAFT_97449 [Zymoseptoria tritici IPO323]EGP82697.1 hypothetical protein MYCGRDRAFT_97449 [Zymoseptoria tritici IPO323]SMR64589.1 unnamed protein product [Zymoseptoria tritici ST99CH_3D1]
MKLAAVISTVLLGAVPVLAAYRPGTGPPGKWFPGVRAWCEGLPDGGGDPIGDACRGVKIDTVPGVKGTCCLRNERDSNFMNYLCNSYDGGTNGHVYRSDNGPGSC